MSRQEHPVWEEELMPYVDGQLAPARESEIADHVKACPECAAAIADARRLSRQMQSWKVEESPETTRERVFAALQDRSGSERAQRSGHWWTNRRVWAYGLTGVFATTLLLFTTAPLLLRSRQGAPVASYEQPLTSVFELERAAVEQTPQQGQQGRQGQSGQQAGAAKELPAEPSGPMVIRTAQLALLTKEFDSARSRTEGIVRQLQGYLDGMTIRGEVGSMRALAATLRLPADRLDSGLVELRKLGRVREESQNSSDVTSQFVDLQARLANARNTEQRLLKLQRERTDKLADVVNVEREISRVREEIERMVAQEKDMSNKVQFATIHLEISEEYRAQIQTPAPSSGTQLRNAAIDGYHAAVSSVLAVALFFLRYGPALLLWAVVLLAVALFARRLPTIRIG
jgi:hypothetical protein